MHLLQNFQIIKSTSWYLDGSLMTNPKQIIHENYHNNHLKTLFPSNLYLHLNISSLLHHIYDLKPLITNCHIKFINIINFINIYIVYHFLPFYPPLSWKTPKNKILKKWKKMLEISLYKCVPKTTIIWRTIPEIQSLKDGIFYHFGPFSTLLTS